MPVALWSLCPCNYHYLLINDKCFMFKVIEEASIRTFYTPSSKVPQVISFFRSYGSLNPFNRQVTSPEKVVMLQCVIPEISHYCSRQYDWIRGYASSPRWSMFPIILCISEWLFSQNSRGFESYNLEKQWISCSPFFPNHLLFSLSKRHTSLSYVLTYIIILPPSSIFDCSINT